MAGFGETFFGRIADRDQAVAVLRGCAWASTVLAVIYAVDPARFLLALGGTALALDVALVLDAALLVFIAAMAYRRRSRAFAALLMAWVLLNTIGTVMLRMSHIPFGNNVFLAVLGVYVALRMVLATRRYHLIAGTRVAGGAAVAKNVAGCVLSVLAVLALSIGFGPLIETRIQGSLTLLVAVLAYSVAFARWFPFLGRLALTRGGV